MTDFDFDMCARQMFRGPSARVFLGWQSIELFAARSQDRPTLYVGIESFGWTSSSSHWLFAVPTPPVLTYYSILVIRPQGAKRRLIRVFALTELAVRRVTRFFLDAQDGTLSTYRHTKALQAEYSVILPVSVGVPEVIDQFCFVEINCNSQFDAVSALKTRKSMATLDWNEFT